MSTNPLIYLCGLSQADHELYDAKKKSCHNLSSPRNRHGGAPGRLDSAFTLSVGCVGSIHHACLYLPICTNSWDRSVGQTYIDLTRPTGLLFLLQVAEEQPWRHSSSLKDRLGLTDQELEILKRSPRSGLGGGDYVRVEQRVTGRSAGGPKTAVGYLLGELRMRPEEV